MYLALESEFQDYTTTDDIDLVNNVFFFWASLSHIKISLFLPHTDKNPQLHKPALEALGDLGVPKTPI